MSDKPEVLAELRALAAKEGVCGHSDDRRLAFLNAADMIDTLSARVAELDKAFSDPEAVYALMLKGVIKTPTARAMAGLFGEVPNGDEAQLAEIATIRARVAELEGEVARLRGEIGRRAWAGVPDAAEWVREIRGHDAALRQGKGE